MKLEKNKDGFTLIELTVVTAIIGVLAAVALPAFDRYRSRARQVEVKLALSHVYTVLKGYHSQNSTYSACLGPIGANPNANDRYYRYGFSDPAATSLTCGSDGTVSCLSHLWNGTTPVAMCGVGNTMTYFNPTASMPYIGLLPMPVSNSVVSQSSFLADGYGRIATQKPHDYWTIDHNKQLLNTFSGL